MNSDNHPDDKTPTWPKKRCRAQTLSAALCLLLAAAAPITTRAQTNGQLYFSDNFEKAASVSPYTLAQQEASNSLATSCVPGPAQVGAWFTYDQADGGPNLFGVQVTDAVDEPGEFYTNSYQGSNVLRVFRAAAAKGAGGSAVIANFTQAQTGGVVRITWSNMVAASQFPYSEMIHVTSMATAGGEGGANAILSLGLSGSGTAAVYESGWSTIPGINNDWPFTWQSYQLDVDLDNQAFTLSVDGNSTGPLPNPAPLAPGSTAAGIAFRGGSGSDDLFYIDSLQAYPILKHITVTSSLLPGQTIASNVPLSYTIANGFNLTNTLTANTNSIQLTINGTVVTPKITSTSNAITVSYLPAAGWTSLSNDTAVLAVSDTENPPVFTTNTVGFSILPPFANNIVHYQGTTIDNFVSLNAQDYNVEIPSADGHSWVLTSNLDNWASPVVLSNNANTNFSGTGVMEAQPNSGVNNGANLAGPELGYLVNFSSPGTYYIWVRAAGDSAPGGSASDSVLIGMDGVLAAQVGNAFPVGEGLVWTNALIGAGPAGLASAAAIVVTFPGQHIINVWMREDGFDFDKLLLTTTASYVPTGTGPAESATNPPVIAPGGYYFSDDFENAAHVSPYTITALEASNSLATLSTPGPAKVGSWFTYDQADGGPNLFGVQVTDDVDEPGQSYTNTYQGSNVLRVLRATAAKGAGGSAVIANFSQPQTGGVVRATWLNMVAASQYPYSEMVLISSLASGGGEGTSDAILALGLSGAGTAAVYAQGWSTIPGITNDLAYTWQFYQLDVDLDNAAFTLTIDGSSSGPLPNPAPLAPGNTAAGIAFRGGSSYNDLFYIDSLQVYPILKHITVASSLLQGETIQSNVPVSYVIDNGFNLTNTLTADTNSIQLTINGTKVAPQVSVGSNAITVTYTPAGGWTALSSNTAVLTVSDTENPPASTTSTVGFSILPVFSNNVARFQGTTADHFVSLNAQDYNLEIPSADGHNWVLTSNLDNWASPVVLSNNANTNFSGTGVMEAQPNSGVNNGANLVGPELDYLVNFTTPGTYYIWVRAAGDSAPGGSANDSVSVGIDGVLSAQVGNAFPIGLGLVWTNALIGAGPAGAASVSAIVVTSPGLHVINVWMREDGFDFDKLLLTTTASYVPSGIGPAESGTSAPGPSIGVTSTSTNMVLTWSGGGQLQSSTSVTGPYTTIQGASSPYTVTFTGSQMFFRVSQ